MTQTLPPLPPRLQAAITARDAARGRRLTDRERVGNLMRWLGEAA